MTTTDTTPRRELTRPKKIVFGITLGAMLAIGVGGGVGTFTNLTAAYGKGTAIGALAAGEGATVILGLLLIGLTMLGKAAPWPIRFGLLALPAAAAAMGATAADHAGEGIVYALTPMAITAAAEGGAYLLRRIVVYTEGRDAEAEARNAKVIRDLAYHQARASAHPSKGTRKRSEKKAWKLAAKVGDGDTALGVQLLAVQRERMTHVAGIALDRMFQPGTATTPAALPVSATGALALPTASAGDPVTSRTREPAIHEETSGDPADIASDQPDNTESVRPALKVVPDGSDKKRSIAADVRQMVKDGVQDVRHVVDAVATRHGRPADDPKLKATVGRYYRAAKAYAKDTDPAPGQYL